MNRSSESHQQKLTNTHRETFFKSYEIKQFHNQTIKQSDFGIQPNFLRACHHMNRSSEKSASMMSHQQK